jgi:hypothetical protein
VQFHSFLTSALDGEWSSSAPAALCPGKSPVSTEQEDGWAPGTVWAVWENKKKALDPAEIQTQDRPAPSLDTVTENYY